MMVVYVVEDSGYDSIGPLGVFASLEGAMASCEGAKWEHFPAKTYPGGGSLEESWQYNTSESSGYAIKCWEVQA